MHGLPADDSSLRVRGLCERRFARGVHKLVHLVDAHCLVAHEFRQLLEIKTHFENMTQNWRKTKIFTYATESNVYSLHKLKIGFYITYFLSITISDKLSG